MLDYLITSKTRIKLLLKFFLNAEARGYLRSLAEEFGESTNAVRVELNRLTEAGLLEAESEGRMKVYRANKKHVLFGELHSIVKKYVGIDRLVDDVLQHLGNVELAFITGDYARGIDSGTINFTIVGEIDEHYLEVLIKKSESLIGRKIEVTLLGREEFNKYREKFEQQKMLVVWGEIK
ncbi:winged helix-turn-helix domain-containing protein [Aneurinibacillus thermoaerophilus]|uniref:Winged helix-turn-helix domain-containing protein n=1 Tax=Aneurinibacillus thermoaerophilus TaxID=143495 RepID=A0ABX8YFV8_ANETH|nr:winged helix-turn-helix domain-containing protein [Aneurinibacillus thermoaerophilus]